MSSILTEKLLELKIKFSNLFFGGVKLEDLEEGTEYNLYYIGAHLSDFDYKQQVCHNEVFLFGILPDFEETLYDFEVNINKKKEYFTLSSRNYLRSWVACKV